MLEWLLPVYFTGSIVLGGIFFAVSFSTRLTSPRVDSLVKMMRMTVTEGTVDLLSTAVRMRSRVTGIGIVAGAIFGLIVAALIPMYDPTAHLSLFALCVLGGGLAGFTYFVRPSGAAWQRSTGRLNNYVAPLFRSTLRGLVLFPLAVIGTYFFIRATGHLNEMYLPHAESAPYVPALSVVIAGAAVIVYLWLEIVGRRVAGYSPPIASAEQGRAIDVLKADWFLRVSLAFFMLAMWSIISVSILIPPSDDQRVDDVRHTIPSFVFALFVVVVLLVMVVGYRNRTVRNHLANRLWAEDPVDATVPS